MKLKEVLVHRPGVEMSSVRKNDIWKEIPKLEKLEKEHDEIVDALRSENVKVNYTLKTLERKPNLIFVRDSAFVIDGKALILRLTSERQGEELLIKERIFQLGFKIVGQLIYPCILEGSNIFLIDEKNALIGINKRANLDGARKFEEITGIKVFPIPQEDISKNFNLIDKTAVISEAILDSQLYEFLKENEFEIIIGNEGMEFLQIDSNKIINFKASLNKKLEKNGFDVIELDLKEFLKCSRGIRSLILPIDYEV